VKRVVSLRGLLILVAATVPLASAAGPHGEKSADAPATTRTDSQKTLTPLVVVGFRADEQLDPRDGWVPTAVEETLAWRLRRVPALTVVPTVRSHQARQELAEKEGDPPAEWSRVVRVLGAKQWLKGSCAGTPHAFILTLELIRTDQPDVKPAQVRLGPGRLFDVIDEATRWALRQLGIARINTTTEELIFAPPSASPSALQYYAKALGAARSDNLRDGAYYIERAVDYDPTFCPALMLMAKIELRSSAATRVRAGLHLRQIKQLAVDRGDALTEAEFELAQGLLLLMTRSFDAARQRFEAALAATFERGDPYGQITAMDSLCDLWLSYEPPARGELPAEALRRFNEQKLRRAAEWQVLVLEMLRQLGDVVAEAPAANKLALIYERLNESELALEMHKQTVAASQKTGSVRNEATGWLFLGQWYRRQERWQEALEATSRCLALAADEAKPAVRIALAEIYRGLSLPREALGQYEAAYEALADGDDLMSQFRCLQGTAELRMELGERRAAIEKLAEALDVAQVLGLAEKETIRKQLEQWKSGTW
jgi:tetratricopeptide (TPR) repeat protein/TolB-like protein